MASDQNLIVFFPHNPYSLNAAFFRRCYDFLKGFRDIGFDVTLCSSSVSSITPWDAASVRGIKRDWQVDVCLYEPGFLEYKFIAASRMIRSFYGEKMSFESARRAFLKQWFNRIIAKRSSQYILIFYAEWGLLLARKEGEQVFRMIIADDLISVHGKADNDLAILFSGTASSGWILEERAIRDDYFERASFVPDQWEFDVYDQYDMTIAINEKEAACIKERTKKTKVMWIPIIYTPPNLNNSYQGPTIFIGGPPSYYNTQGYYYFIKRALPLIKRRLPDFSVEVSGSFPQPVPPEEGIVLLGFVPDLKPIYKEARFVICPLIAGTGQKTRIVEAMAHGLAVVATKQSAEGSPLDHGVNGFIAKTAEEFAEYTVQLWSDQAMCRKFGEAAREKIASKFSHARLLKDLSSIFK